MLNVVLISTNRDDVKYNSMAKVKCICHAFSFNFIALYCQSRKTGLYDAQQRQYTKK